MLAIDNQMAELPDIVAAAVVEVPVDKAPEVVDIVGQVDYAPKTVVAVVAAESSAAGHKEVVTPGVADIFVPVVELDIDRMMSHDTVLYCVRFNIFRTITFLSKFSIFPKFIYFVVHKCT